jgi:hypothetical protein
VLPPVVEISAVYPFDPPTQHGVEECRWRATRLKVGASAETGKASFSLITDIGELRALIEEIGDVASSIQCRPMSAMAR